MAMEIRVPTLGESVTEATIARWFKKEGDAVKADEPLVELETDKVTLEVPSPAAGTLASIAIAAGETVNVGSLLGAIEEGAAAVSGEKPAQRASEPARSAPEAPAEKPKAAAQPLSPAVRKMVEENKLDASVIEGSGKDGRITKGDVIAEIAKPARIEVPRVMPAAPPPTPPQTARPLAPPDDAKREERVKMTRLRQTIARRLKDAQNTAAMLTTFNEVDMSAV
ncbi:MAG: E3 binding domain-containing protein, partial [Rhizobiales bacterium]|nr:E3 binding domain-containing protein [Hyphomicrobiales bacterium]